MAVTTRVNETRRAAARFAGGAAARHDGRQRPLPDGPCQLERRAVRGADERALLFTDFRYAESARAIDGVEFVQTQRSLMRTVGEELKGRASASRRARSLRRLGEAARRRSRARAAARARREAARGEGRRRAGDDPRARAHHGRGVRRARRGACSSAAPSATSPGAWSSCCARAVRTASRSRTSSAARTARCPHGEPSDRAVEPRRSSSSTRARCSTATTRTARARSRRASSRRLAQRTTCACAASSRASTGCAPACTRREADAGVTRADRGRRSRREVRARSRPRPRPARPRGADGPPSRRTRSSRAT